MTPSPTPDTDLCAKCQMRRERDNAGETLAMVELELRRLQEQLAEMEQKLRGKR